MSALKDAMKKAFESKGIELPKAEKKVVDAKTIERPKIANRGAALAPITEREPKKHPSNSRRDKHRRSARSQSAMNSIAKNFLAAQQKVQPGLPGASVYEAPTKPEKTAPAPVAEYELCISEGVAPAYQLHNEPEEYIYLAPRIAGIEEQAHTGSTRDDREIVIGLDFGTSSVKIIIGDQSLDKAFAVPFSKADGVSSYLLPSRLYQTNSNFSLVSGQDVHRDLKLGLLANPDDVHAQIKVVAFLALLIRHSRGWLFSENEGVFNQSNILWKLVLGLPSAHHLKSKHQEVFQKLATVAWYLSSLQIAEIDAGSVQSALKMFDESAITMDQMAEICVVPEISAQIYGYVSSNSFDPEARNIFLMVDVGAGTVDSSLFHVKSGRGGKWDFTFYTSQVQPNGVMNLHRHRMNWWEDALTKSHVPEKIGVGQIHEAKFFTDRMSKLPESFLEYFSGIEVKFNNIKANPDSSFFMKQIVAQVRGRTVWRTWKDGLLSQHDLEGVPMFMCGGGSRMNYYRELEPEMSRFEGCSWLKANPRSLEIPAKLIAPGLPSADYDRLSVAFGLSFLEVRSVLQAIPGPEIVSDGATSWQLNYQLDRDDLYPK